MIPTNQRYRELHLKPGSFVRWHGTTTQQFHAETAEIERDGMIVRVRAGVECADFPFENVAYAVPLNEVKHAAQKR